MSGRTATALLVVLILLALTANWLLGLDKIDGDTGCPVASAAVCGP